jgi:hypothetical protein
MSAVSIFHHQLESKMSAGTTLQNETKTNIFKKED